MRIKLSAIRLFAVFFLLLSGVSCSDSLDLPDTPPQEPETDTAKSLTLVYMMAENSLSSYAKKDIDEMMVAASSVPDDGKLLVFIDDNKLPRIYHIHADDGTAVCDTVYRFENDFCSSDTTAMRVVFDWVYENYPADSLNLIMWSHGSGWVNGTMQHAPMQKSIGVDNERNSAYSNNTMRAIEMNELADFLCTQPMPVQMLMFDACFMQTVETMFELRNSAKWILASPAEIPGDGAPYDKIMEALFSVPFNAHAVMEGYYRQYENDRFGVLLSLVDCSAIEEFANTTALFVPTLFDRANVINHASLFSYLPGGYFINSVAYYPDYTDINSVMKEYLAPADYDMWKISLDKVVVNALASDSWFSAPHRSVYMVDRNDYCGLSMYIPRDSEAFKNYNIDFATTQWYRYTGWEAAGW